MPDDVLALWPLAPASETDRLAGLTQDDGLTGIWGTKVCGPRPLVEALLADTELEAVRLPWISWVCCPGTVLPPAGAASALLR
ncbi:hypothetical protein ACWGE1_29145 [Streptomyces sp. NPDC054932]